MKIKTLLQSSMTLIALFIGLSVSNAQFVATQTSYEGYWAGQLTNSNDEDDKAFLVLKIENGQAKRLDYDEEKNDFVESNFGKEMSSLLGNNFSFVWMNQGGIWSETQSHSLSYLNERRLWCLMVRQVTNAQEDEDVPGINDEWNLVYEGGLNYYRSLLALREAFLD